ncbi:MAG: histidine--tRNA ligase [Gemmatimonadetes bacterium]|nr:histidine--tRNA ligase [Gemmatimonadota bacterium]MCK5489658.1 histidine--tRNA ligase [Gemmatimonadota bacterium]
MTTTSLPGFRDFYPADLALRAHIFRTWRAVASRYGFVEYDGPPLESLDLYTRKSGEEIVGQLYGFTDQGGREVALRPEMTPTFARMVAARAGGLPKPIKWFSVPQLFRYERPQKGRLREHFQLNLDIVGETSVASDVEVVAAAVDMLREFGLGAADFVARYSDRGLISAVLQEMGIPEASLPAAFAALDKADRESEEWVIERLVDARIEPDSAKRVLDLTGMDLGDLSRQFGDVAAVGECLVRLNRFREQIEAAGLEDFVELDLRLVRGLAYYTGLVFEIWDRKGKFRAICGGGRYDDLLEAVGGPALPALGFGMGDVVLGELLRDRDLVPEGGHELDDFVIHVSDEQLPAALRIVHSLRARGRRVGFDYRSRSVGRQFKVANQAGAARVIVVGPEEVERDECMVRSMDTGEEVKMGLAELLAGSD